MRDIKGITLVSVVIYIILILITLITLSTLMAHFSGEVENLSTSSTYDVEFEKFNLYILDELQRTNNYVLTPNTENNNTSNIIFANEDEFSYDDTNSIINLNTDIKLCEYVEGLQAELTTENSKPVLIITLNIAGTSKTTKYLAQVAPTEQP